jgi:transposase
VAGRHELTLAEWTRMAPLLPARETRGTCYADHRRVLNGMLYRHTTGCAWRDLPVATAMVHGRFAPAPVERDGLWGRILAALPASWPRRIDWELWCIDGSHVRAGAQPRRVHDQAASRH